MAQQKVDPATVFQHVLLIEDDAGHAALLKRALRGLVGEVLHLSTGSRAVEAVKERRPDLVLCDLNLPDVTALELIPHLQQLAPNLPIVVLTSSSDLEHAVAAMREGAWDFMVKQFSDELHDRFDAVLTRAAERKAALLRELQVQRERDAFWTAAQAAQDGVAILDRGGEIVFANEAFKRFLSLLPQTGEMNFSARLMAHDRALGSEFTKHLSPTAAKIFWSCEVTFHRAEPLYFELTLSSVHGENQLVLWSRDITSIKEQERFQRDLLSTTSHDLKGPLGAILNSAELIEVSPGLENPRSRDLVTRIASCARSCISIIDEFLSARRIQDGVFILKPMWLPLNDALSEIVLDYQPIARAKAIDFHYTVPSSKAKVYADPMAFKRILGNLVSNALKFTPKGGTVVVSSFAETPADQRVSREGHSAALKTPHSERPHSENESACTRIAVTDSGVGIDAKDRHLLFERYGRLEKHHSVDGTGLGLFVTKSLVDAHSGRIEVKSELGKGTQFVVWFPHPVGRPGLMQDAQGGEKEPLNSPSPGLGTEVS